MPSGAHGFIPGFRNRIGDTLRASTQAGKTGSSGSHIRETNSAMTASAERLPSQAWQTEHRHHRRCSLRLQVGFRQPCPSQHRVWANV